MSKNLLAGPFSLPSALGKVDGEKREIEKESARTRERKREREREKERAGGVWGRKGGGEGEREGGIKPLCHEPCLHKVSTN